VASRRSGGKQRSDQVFRQSVTKAAGKQRKISREYEFKDVWLAMGVKHGVVFITLSLISDLSFPSLRGEGKKTERLVGFLFE
jgi:hypothetical protein